jgi:hypothetical protein
MQKAWVGWLPGRPHQCQKLGLAGCLADSKLFNGGGGAGGGAGGATNGATGAATIKVNNFESINDSQ